VDGTGTEDQKRDEEYDENNPWVSQVHTAGGGELTAILLSLKDVEKIRESAYRAGREDAARDLLAYAQNYPESVFPPDSDSRDAIGGTAMRHAYRNASEIARGPGVQPTEEQRAREEDQNRDEEQR
jgi:hypothetical protein